MIGFHGAFDDDSRIAAMMVCQFVWGLFFMPETKGGSIEDIERRLGIV